MQNNFEDKYTTDRNYYKFRYHFYFKGKYKGAAHSICNLKYSIPKDIHVVFHNGSNYHYYFIIKELAKEIKGEFNCLGKNSKK